MGYIVAVAGKGGTGKTTISALLINWLNQHSKGSVLAIDADPNMNLASVLGAKAQQDIGQLIDSIAQNPAQVPSGMSKDNYIEYRIQTSLFESNGFDSIAMGRPEGPGCYCYANNVLRGVIKKLQQGYDFTVIDNEAGLEHLSRRTTRSADCLLVVSDYSVVGMRTAKRIYALVKEMQIKTQKDFLLVNRCFGNDESLNQQIEDLGFDFVEKIPEDKEVLELSIQGKPIRHLSDKSLAKKSIERLAKKLWP